MFCSKCGSEIPKDSIFCPNCGEQVKIDKTKNFPEGQELLQGLYLVQDFLINISDKLNRFWELERYYRKTKDEFKTETVVEKGQYGLFYAGISFSIVSLIPSLLIGNMEGLIVGALASFLFWRGKTKESKKLLYIGMALLAFLGVNILTAIPRGFQLSTAAGIGAVLLYGTSLVIGALVTKFVVDKYNKKIVTYNVRVNADNSEVDRKRQQLSDEINSLNRELQLETSSWFPVDYYVIDAVNSFITLVKNHEVDTVKEMVSVYKKDKYRSEHIMNLQAMNQKIDQSLYNQEKMMNLQKISNVLLLGNLVTNMVTASKVDQVVKNTDVMAHAAYKKMGPAERVVYDEFHK